jgi:succinyl-diaminopimelate desuccinylase
MDKTINFIENQEQTVIELQKGLTGIPAVNPENGGDGEYEKFKWLKSYLAKFKFDSIEEILVPDDRVSSKIRPSLIASINGKDDLRSFWIITHLDVVPPGEVKLWDADPFQAVVKDGKIYGRGTEDNQQSLVSSIIAAKTLIENGIKPSYNVKLLFVADEEVGSYFGIQWILDNRNLFTKEDLLLTPDGGHPEGKIIEVAEKSILWLQFKIIGRQSHGSRPDLGINTSKVSSHLVVRMEDLYKKFSHQDKMYDIPYSTFEPTKRSNAVANINTIPGEELLCYDCRVMPVYRLDTIIEEVKKITMSIEKDFGVRIDTEIMQKVDAPKPTSPDAPIVLALKKSIKKILNIEAEIVGVGGGTVAAYFRMRGYSAALWSTIENKMHSPNEYSVIKNTLNDAKVFSDLMINCKEYI